MIKVFFMVLIYFFIGVIELIPMYKDTKLKEIKLYTGVMVISLILSLMLILGFKFISIAELLGRVIGIK